MAEPDAPTILRGHRDGQATVEAALALPVVLISLLLIVQVGVVVRDALSLGLAAREGAREGAVSAQESRVRDAVIRSRGPLQASAIVIEISPSQSQMRRGEQVSVRLRYTERLNIPVVNRIVTTSLVLRAESTMRLERTGPTPAPTPAPTADPTPQPTATPGLTPTPTPSTQPDPGGIDPPLT